MQQNVAIFKKCINSEQQTELQNDKSHLLTVCDGWYDFCCGL